ncbi:MULTISPECIES: hypothetical protein [Streptomyces]|uniref:Uncharacterized protein n=1 Tax=Streptomyces canarius TaxID=285453 RepID=A0ABQ3CDB8_9ACTN|nr:hypothetical protein [Streptomyces canarius]GHA02765.1 hypothetical protein GCM10010345_03550 [Streptomyces canarius]
MPLTEFGAWFLLISVTFVLVERLGTAGRDRCAGRPEPGPRPCPPPVSDSFKTG